MMLSANLLALLSASGLLLLNLELKIHLTWLPSFSLIELIREKESQKVKGLWESKKNLWRSYFK
jgi:hypothetical protein